MTEVSSKIEEIGSELYIVERDEKDKIICKSLYEKPEIKIEPEIGVVKLTELEFREMVLKKLGYRIKE